MIDMKNYLRLISGYACRRSALGLCCVALSVAPSLVSAEEFTYSENGATLTYSVLDESAKTCAVVWFDDMGELETIAETVVLPEHPKNGEIEYTLTQIGDGEVAIWDGYGDGLPNVSFVIPGSVTKISEKAFNHCYNLISVTIPNSVTSIGVNAFLSCGLTSVTIPNSITVIEGGAFSSCNLTSVEIPGSVTKIGNKAFYQCLLTTVEIPNSVTEIGNSAFFGTNLTSLTIPASVTKIEPLAFAGCTSLTQVVVESGNPSYIIEDGVLFYKDKTELVQCFAWKEGDYVIPSSVTSIDEGAFWMCEGLTSVTIPTSVTELANNTFYGCLGLTSVEIPNSVTKIGEYAFQSCQSLTSVSIPESVTKIEQGTFYRCSSLTSVNIPNSVTEIGSMAFSGCSALTSVNIPNTVTEIGSMAFNSCSALTSIDIPNSVRDIASFTFEFCKNLETVVLGQRIISIGHQAFRGCVKLSKLYVLSWDYSPYFEYDTFEGVACQDVDVYVAKGLMSDYKDEESSWKIFTKFYELGAIEVTLNQLEADLMVGESVDLTASTVLDSDVTITSTKWESSKPSVATVDSNGKVNAVAIGAATITVTVTDNYGQDFIASCDVKVTANAGITTVDGECDDVAAEYYDLRGRRVNAEGLVPGVYVVRKGTETRKVCVK